MWYSVSTMAHAGGRPPKYKSVRDLQKIVKQYFDECDPHWIEEEYWDYPFKSNKSTYRDRSKPMQQFTRMRLTEQEPYTMSGLGRRIGLSRQALSEYNASDEFGDTIKAARNKVEEFNERMLSKGKNVAGVIFNLKVNFHYRDTPEKQPPPENPINFINNVPIEPD